MSKFEFILKVRTSNLQPFEVKYRSVVPSARYLPTVHSYNERIIELTKADSRLDYVLLINQLSDDGEFETTIQ